MYNRNNCDVQVLHFSSLGHLLKSRLIFKFLRLETIITFPIG